MSFQSKLGLNVMLLVTENLWLTKYIFVKIFMYRRDAREFVDAIYLIVNKAFLFLLGGYYRVCWREYFLSGTISKQTFSNEAILAKCELGISNFVLAKCDLAITCINTSEV